MLRSSKYIPAALITALQLAPMMVFGQTRIDELVRGGGIFATTLNTLISILFVLATLIFLWGVIQFIAKSGDEKARESAKGIMTWGIVGLAVMAAAWGVVNILTRYFLNQSGGSPTIPGAPGAF